MSKPLTIDEKTENIISSIIIIDEQIKTKRSSMPHKKKKSLTKYVQ